MRHGVSFAATSNPARRGAEADVVAVLAAVGDLDNDKYSLGELPVEAPYIVETSPGNFQSVYIFEKPLAPAAAKPALAALCDFVGGDSATKDTSHVWRIPGCLNWPTKSKLARGRSPDPVPVTVKKEYDGGFTSPATLLALAPRGRRPNGHDTAPPGSLTLAEKALLHSALAAIPADDRDIWVKVGAPLRLCGARAVWDDWSKKSSKFDAADQDRVWASFHAEWQEGDATIASIYELAKEHGWVAAGISLDDFNAYMPAHTYIFTPSREMWPAASVNARIPPASDNGAKPVSASAWLDKHKSVEQMTWAPGEPTLIQNRLISDGGWIERTGVTCFNLYRPPVPQQGNPAEAGPWLAHAASVFGGDSEHITKWLAHRVQRPQEKINHALFLCGHQGIGKDTLLEPIKHAIGPWNFAEVSPQQMLGRFNGFLKSVILRVSESRDLGDRDRFQFYDHMKAYTAAPPDVLRVDEKHLREHAVLNCCGVVMTSNHKADGIYLPPDDRRHFVAWSDLTKEEFTSAYWNGLWGWYADGGYGHVAAYLAGLDLASFDPKAPPPKTPAFWAIADANRAPEEDELADILDKLKNPDATTNSRIVAAAAGSEIEMWLRDRKNRRAIPHRLEKCGYVPVRNGDREDGRWIIGGERQVVYAKKTLSVRDRFTAARAIASDHAGGYDGLPF